MKTLILICILFPFLNFGQTTFSAQYGEYKHKWTFRINSDSSIIMIRDIDKHSYEEYTGHIKKINDSIFDVKSSLTFSQVACRAIGDSLLYVHLDENLSKTIRQLEIEYTKQNKIQFQTKNKDEIKVPINKKLFNKKSGNNFFYVSFGHINPLTNTEVKTVYKIGNEYCLDVYQENDINFQVKIKNNKLVKIGEGRIDNFTLLKE